MLFVVSEDDTSFMIKALVLNKSYVDQGTFKKRYSSVT